MNLLYIYLALQFYHAHGGAYTLPSAGSLALFLSFFLFSFSFLFALSFLVSLCLSQ